MRDEPLPLDVDLVDAPVRLARVEDAHGLARQRATARPGTSTSTTKQPPGSRCAATLRKQATCASCVVRFSIVLKTTYASENVPATRGRREVADRDADLVTAGLGPQPRGHRLRQLDAVHRHSPRCERQRDPPGPDPELERSAAAREPGEEVDRWIDHRRVEHVRRGLVVPGCDASRRSSRRRAPRLRLWLDELP